jgi:hypothetical protein
MKSHKHIHRPLLLLGIAALLAIGLWLGIRALLAPTSFTLNRFEVAAIHLRWMHPLTKDTLACKRKASAENPGPKACVEIRFDLSFVSDSTQQHARYLSPTGPKGRDGANDPIVGADWSVHSLRNPPRILPEDFLAPIDSACYTATLKAANQDPYVRRVAQMDYPPILSLDAMAEMLNAGKDVPKTETGIFAMYVWLEDSIFSAFEPDQELGFQLSFRSGKVMRALLEAAPNQ